ncbi:hypothetical protein [Streptoalloteichus hindustanus]|uniref:Uncharacterized protein n=1 Tax=Streptoalloteichus hindustanus TaxID=2017 RepID=A0A1M5P3T7_STRHI|nr:hypothetical protein [Streptoalloteichus hindustanus]SHG96079.1 hypothetical protein SAMN05444320_11750 [Streptoalloteichus hindustanus]
MARCGTVFGRYLAAVQRFVAQLDQPEDAARLGGMTRAVLGGDGAAMITFLCTARKCLTTHNAPEGLWAWHEKALAIVIDRAVAGSALERLDSETHQRMLRSYRSAGGSPVDL